MHTKLKLFVFIKKLRPAIFITGNMNYEYGRLSKYTTEFFVMYAREKLFIHGEGFILSKRELCIVTMFEEMSFFHAIIIKYLLKNRSVYGLKPKYT